MKKIIILILLNLSLVQLFGQTPCPNCGSSCQLTNNLNISTGFNPSTNQLIPIGTVDPLWKLINNPPTTCQNPPQITIDNAYRVSPSPIASVWNAVPNAGILSSIPSAHFQCNNLNNNQPWRFRRTFCVCSDNTPVRIRVEFRADDIGTLHLLTPNGASIFLAASLPHSDPSHCHCWASQHLDTILTLNSGCHHLEFFLWNTNAVAMGFALGGSLEVISPTVNNQLGNQDGNCCKIGVITGQKILDNNSNGIIDSGDQPGGFGWTFQLLNSFGNIVSTTHSNSLGEFMFNNLSPDTYTVQEVLQSGWTPTNPANGLHTITVSQNNLNHNVRFLNAPVNCCDGLKIYTNPTDISCCYNLSFISTNCIFQSAVITSLNNVPISINNTTNTQFTFTNLPTSINVQHNLANICVQPSPLGFALIEIRFTTNDGKVCKDTVVLACPIPSRCCDINQINVNAPTNFSTADYGNFYGFSFNLPISTGPVSFEELRASIVSYELEYSDAECAKCYNHYSYMGTFLLQSSPQTIGTLIRQALPHYNTSAIPGTSPTRNGVREIIWKGQPSQIGNVSPIFEILFPKPLLPNCCDVRVKVCIKLVFKDVNCDICEIYKCLEFNQNGVVSLKAKKTQR